ncbi:TetR/AcrR family transcriptional regulator [Streptomyces sp. NPDC060030]|uniref:TetR/AcrR family transcriptional regulator n=1 Tax=Streptomyces sp. NPDC060030 TaxID=3347042 RepID=UPI0036C9B27F
MTRGQTSGVPLPGAPCGLRESRKRRTREALLHAALRLFLTQGYDRTTVDEIVEAVEVSQRTFFRYFVNKEAVALAAQEAVDARFLAELRQRPASETPFEAMRQAVLHAWSTLPESGGTDMTPELRVRAYRMIESTPALRAAHTRRTVGLEQQTTALIAEREGIDPEADPRARVAVAAFSGVMRMTGQVWGGRKDAGIDALRELTELHLDQLGPALSGSRRVA